jgi:hypothetical protein
MTLSSRIATAALVLAMALATIEAGAWLGIPGVRSVVSQAEAVVGRPLTPVSYAGVARRTARRCAGGAYAC